MQVNYDKGKFAFARLQQKKYPRIRREVKYKIHPSAIIDERASIHQSVIIGPYCVIGPVHIDSGTIIGSHVVIEKGVIGKNVIIQPQATIGVEGLSHVRNESGEYEEFPNVGNVVIGDNVWIASRANVDRGTVDDTIIGRGTKISKCVNVGHNVVIGEHTFIAGHSNLGGGCYIGDYCFIGMGTIVKNKKAIGSRSCIGMGSIVVDDIRNDTLAYGNPAETRGMWTVSM